MQWQSEAIQNAINHYNIQAVALNPPRPKISWKDIADYSFIGEFDLLRHSQVDIWTNDWAKPAHREATTKYFKLCRAHEEVTRLNVEIRRLCTAMHTEEIQTSAVIQDLLISDQRLAQELQCQWCSRAAINAVHSYHLDRIESLTGFSGVRGVGVHAPTTVVQHTSTTLNDHADSGKFYLLLRNFKLIYLTAATQTRNVDDIGALISSDYTDMDAIDREECDMTTEDMADYLHSIID